MTSMSGMYHVTEDFIGRTQGYPYFRWKIRLTPDPDSELTREELLAGIITELTEATLRGVPEIWLSLQRPSGSGERHEKYLKDLSSTAIADFVARFFKAHDSRRRRERAFSALAVCKSYFGDDTRLSMSSMRASKERALMEAFTHTLSVSPMRLDVSPESPRTQIFSWPCVKGCSDLHATFTLSHVMPECTRDWLLDEKIRAGPLRLRMHINLHDSWHDTWESSGQRFLMRICMLDRRFPFFDCTFSFMGSRGLRHLLNEYELKNTKTGQKFTVVDRTREVHIGYFEHILSVSCE